MRKIPIINSDKFIIVDDEDFDKLNSRTWKIDTFGYAYSYKELLIIRAHTMVAGYLHVDHKDRDKLNNTRANLRPATKSQNMANTPKRLAGATSVYRGVAWMRSRCKWRARIKVNYKSIHLGLFESELDAARAFNRAAEKYFGEYAVLNPV